MDVVNKFAELLNWECGDVDGGVCKCKFTHEVTFIAYTDSDDEYTGENGFVYLYAHECEWQSPPNKEKLLRYSSTYLYKDKVIRKFHINTIVHFLIYMNLLPNVSILITNRERVF